MYNSRTETRDRLADCGCQMPPPMPPFPAPVMPPSVFEEMMYRVAFAAGYLGTKDEFREDLANALNGANDIPSPIVQKETVDDFPDIGKEDTIYIDMENKEIYFWNEDGYYKIGVAGEGEGSIPPDGLTYEGGVI